MVALVDYGAGGDTPSNINNINFLTISTAGDATDFGDLVTVKSSFCAASNSTIAAWGWWIWFTKCYSN